MHKEEFISVKASAVLAFDKTFGAYVSHEEADKIFYVLAKKFLNHINSFGVVLEGTSFNDVSDNTFQVDHASAKVLLRAAFESYMTISHLFFNKSSHTDFRILLYKYSGLKERSEKLPREWADNELIKKISNEQRDMEKLKVSIYELGEKLEISVPLIKKAIDDGWRAGNGWVKIGKSSSLPSKYVEVVYPYLCGFSHSGYESYMQLVTDEGLSLSKLEENQSTLYFYAALLIAHFCESYVAFTSSKIDVGFDQVSDVGSFLYKYKDIYS
ncbi:TPA: hypothetical protein P0E13_005186 [Vibrio harveyi]|nr:hypothetical protein [Vibrio harveyi]